MRNTRSGEQKYVVTITPWVVNQETYPPFFLPERCFFLLARCTGNPVGCTDSGSMPLASHVSVKQSMLQSWVSLWKATLALISSTLLTRDWTLASSASIRVHHIWSPQFFLHIWSSPLILSVSKIPYRDKWRVEKWLESFPCLTARLYGYYDISNVDTSIIARVYAANALSPLWSQYLALVQGAVLH